MPEEGILTDFQSRYWAMEARALEEFLQRVAKIEVTPEQMAAAMKQEVKSRMVIADGVAVVPITGYLMKDAPRWLRFFFDITDYREIARDLKHAVENDSVKQILLMVDSPGGEVAGSEIAENAIWEARQAKQLDAYIEDLGASGAYRLASQARKIAANSDAVVGSIGVYAVYVDYSKMAEGLGVKVHVIRSGEHKGMGVQGAEISEKQIAAIQEVIDDMAGNFVKVIARGRGMEKSKVKELATGQAWLAGKAKKLGLIDQVTMLKDALSGWAASEIKSLEGGDVVAEKNEKEVKVELVDEDAIKKEAADSAVSAQKERLSALKAAFPDDIEFVVEQHEKDATVEAAKAAYSEVLKTRLEESEKQKAGLEKKLAGKAAAEGVEGVEFQESTEGGDSRDFMELARATAKEKKISMRDAMVQVAHEDPALHDAWVEKQPKRKM